MERALVLAPPLSIDEPTLTDGLARIAGAIDAASCAGTRRYGTGTIQQGVNACAVGSGPIRIAVPPAAATT
jgi:hypothetical protein